MKGIYPILKIPKILANDHFADVRQQYAKHMGV
jgi:hypothetical protein